MLVTSRGRFAGSGMAGVAVDAAIAVAVGALGLWTATAAGLTAGRVLAVLVAAVAAGLARRSPGVALITVWVAGALHATVASTSTVLGALDLAVLVVAFGTARYGSRVVVWLAGLSIPLAAAVAFWIAATHPYAFPEAQFAALLQRLTGLGVVGALLAGVAVLAAPFALGLLLRLEQRHRRDEAAHRVEQAHALALAKEQQTRTRLTREVHDVVGHSLAVIIAQADAARLSATRDDPVVRDALERIATVGRASLAEVRDVLSRTGEDADEAVAPDLDELVAGVRAAGHDVDATHTGTPVTLDPAVAAASYRVLQELLTNALRHGTPGGIAVERIWTPTGLTVRVSNPASDDTPDGTGTGLSSARDRLAAHEGTLHTARVQGRFVATVFLPLTVPAATR